MIAFALLAALLSAGNAEFEATATQGAFEIAARRERARLIAEGPRAGTLAKALLEDPKRFAHAAEGKAAAWEIYHAATQQEMADALRKIGETLKLNTRPAIATPTQEENATLRQQFETRYAAERAEACRTQMTTLIGDVRPSMAELETLDDATLRKVMSEKVAARQQSPVFEENQAYISTHIVDPMLEAAKKERKRQNDYLRRVRSDAAAPSTLADDLTTRLVENVRERQTKNADPAANWGVFTSVTNITLKKVVRQRIMDRLGSRVADVTMNVTSESVAKAIAGNRAQHGKANESATWFRHQWTMELQQAAIDALTAETPVRERTELADYLRKNAIDESVTKQINKRIDNALMPQLQAVRKQLSDAEFKRVWPTLENRTWWPDAHLTDKTCARSDYVLAVRNWREMAHTSLAKGYGVFDETSARASSAVSHAFEIARSALTAQNRLVDEMHQPILREARARKDSFWRLTPDLNKIITLLTDAVETRWSETKVTTLWPNGNAPENAAQQHAELFPSVRKRIELLAKVILAEMNETPPEETPITPPLTYAIVVERNDEQVTIKLDHDGETIIERKAKAQMPNFDAALREVGRKLGKDVLKLK